MIFKKIRHDMLDWLRLLMGIAPSIGVLIVHAGPAAVYGRPKPKAPMNASKHL